MADKTRMERFSFYVNLANNLWNHGKTIRQWYVDNNTHTLTLPEQAYVYPAVMEWLNDQVESRRYKVVSTPKGVKRFYDGKGKNVVSIDGHQVTVFLDQKEGQKRNEDSSDNEADYMVYSTPMANLTFSARTPEAMAAVEKLLNDLTEKIRNSTRVARLYNLASYGWEFGRRPIRSLESVFLPQGVKENLLGDIQKFLDSEDKYKHVGIPYHRGYLLYGPPGNGKSSIVGAVANELNLHLYNLPLSSITSDRHLMDSINRVQENSILLLEDIDVFSSTKSREDGNEAGGDEKGPTLAGLLNALDGVSTPHGLITFITTNHETTLDPALIRPGRVDYRLNLLPPDRHQIETIFQHVYDEPLNIEHTKEFSSMAELVNVFKLHSDDVEAARLEIKGS